MLQLFAEITIKCDRSWQNY